MADNINRMPEDPSVRTYAQALEAVPHPVALIDTDGRLADASRSFLSLWADGPGPIPDALGPAVRSCAAHARTAGAPVAREIEVRGAPVRLTDTPLSAGHSLLSVSGSFPADAAAAFCLTLPRVEE